MRDKAALRDLINNVLPSGTLCTPHIPLAPLLVRDEANERNAVSNTQSPISNHIPFFLFLHPPQSALSPLSIYRTRD